MGAEPADIVIEASEIERPAGLGEGARDTKRPGEPVCVCNERRRVRSHDLNASAGGLINSEACRFNDVASISGQDRLVRAGSGFLSELDLFALSEQRLDWIGRRHAVLSENIANADTPGYRPRDIPSFAAAMADASPGLSLTNPLHLAALHPDGAAHLRAGTARAPDGNAVDLDTELKFVADGETDASLVGGVWKSYMGMFMTALGRGG